MLNYFKSLPCDLLWLILTNFPLSDYKQLLFIDSRFRMLILASVDSSIIKSLVELGQINLLRIIDKLGRLEPNIDLRNITHHCKDYQVLKWLHSEKKAKIDEVIFREALHLKNFDIINYLLEYECRWPEDIYTILKTYDIRRNQELRIYKLVYSQPCPFIREKSEGFHWDIIITNNYTFLNNYNL